MLLRQPVKTSVPRNSFALRLAGPWRATLNRFARRRKLTSPARRANPLHFCAVLEELLGIKLFDRSSRSVALTRLGRELVPAFQRILREFDETVAGVRDIARHDAGSVRLGVLPSFAAGILP